MEIIVVAIIALALLAVVVPLVVEVVQGMAYTIRCQSAERAARREARK